jgi:hypothetical protein
VEGKGLPVYIGYLYRPTFLGQCGMIPSSRPHYARSSVDRCLVGPIQACSLGRRHHSRQSPAQTSCACNLQCNSGGQVQLPAPAPHAAASRQSLCLGGAGSSNGNTHGCSGSLVFYAVHRGAVLKLLFLYSLYNDVCMSDCYIRTATRFEPGLNPNTTLLKPNRYKPKVCGQVRG